MKLVIAEKPSVAISIAKVIGATKKKDGYYEGNGYKVSWCVGHLIQMANPDSYDEKYAKWNMADLPIIPREYKYEIKKKKRRMITFCKSKSRVKNAKDRLSLKRQRLKLSDLTKKSPKHRSFSQVRKLPQITKNLWSFQNCSRICKNSRRSSTKSGRNSKVWQNDRLTVGRSDKFPLLKVKNCCIITA